MGVKIERNYRINGRDVDRKEWFDYLTAGPWTVASLGVDKNTVPAYKREDEGIPVTPEKAQFYREQYKKFRGI